MVKVWTLIAVDTVLMANIGVQNLLEDLLATGEISHHLVIKRVVFPLLSLIHLMVLFDKV